MPTRPISMMQPISEKILKVFWLTYRPRIAPTIETGTDRDRNLGEAQATHLLSGALAVPGSLGGCHRALGARGKVLIVDPVIPRGNVPHYGKLLDLEMLVLTPRGRERTKDEFAKLLRGAGFRLARVIATASPLSIVEAVKA